MGGWRESREGGVSVNGEELQKERRRRTEIIGKKVSEWRNGRKSLNQRGGRRGG